MSTSNNNISIDWSSDRSYLFSRNEKTLSSRAREELLSCKGIFWFATSGTVSRKWIGLSKEGFLASARAVNTHLNVSEKDRWALCLPIEHVGGFSIHARSFTSGCRVERLDGAWESLRAHAFLQDNMCTLVSLVPTQLYDLVKCRLRAPPSLRAALIGGATFDPMLREKALALNWPVLSTYGSTEASSQIACQTIDTIRASISPSLEVLPHVQTRTTIEGSLEIKGRSVVQLIATPTSDGGVTITDPLHDGWFTTSDHVELNMQNRKQLLRMIGRADRQVKVLGELVSLDALELEIKNYLRRSTTAVPNIVLVPIAEDRRGMVIHLLIESFAKGSVNREALNNHLGGLKRIEAIHVIEKFPRLENSKIDMAALRRRIEE